jgi:hypothetical protein
MAREGLAAAVALLLAGSSAMFCTACRQKEEPVPATVADEADGELKRQHHALDVFTLVQSDGSYRVLVFKLPKASDADSDYRLVVYRKQGGLYVRHGSEFNLVDFERPRLSSGPPPRIETTERRLGVRYHFVIDGSGAEMVPSEGTLEGGALLGHPTDR